MRVYYVDSCNCDWGCPCQFNASPAYINCKYMGGFHIKTSNYGNINVDKLNMAWIGSFPGSFHEGHGKALFGASGKEKGQ